MPRSRYLITGGAGFLGINLCRFLLPRGAALRSLDIAPFDYPERGAVEALLGDIRDTTTVDHAMTGVDIVVHCAAALPLSSRQEIFSTNVEGTRILLESAVDHRASRFINISSTAIYGIPSITPSTRMIASTAWVPMANPRSRRRSCAGSFAPKVFACPSFVQRASLAPSGSACSNCFMAGPMKAEIFPSSDPETTAISSWTLKILAAGWDFLVNPVMREGGYVRYDGRKSEQILRDCRTLLAEYGGRLSRLHAVARDPADLEARLDAFYGVGPVTVNIFLRELRPFWAKADPAPLPAVLALARRLGVALGRRRKTLRFARIESGLIRRAGRERRGGRAQPVRTAGGRAA
jgi:hypothetical protein